MDDGRREAGEPAGGKPDEPPELTHRGRLAVRFANRPLISLLILDRRLGWVLLALGLMLLGMGLSLPKLWRTSPAGFSARGAREHSGPDPGLVAATERRQLPPRMKR